MKPAFLQPNKWFFRDRLRSMPRMRNLPPYDSNQIAVWFAQLYQVEIKQGARLFHHAISASREAAKANPEQWPPFLLFDQATRQWHGRDVP
jgi:hypothetical protein